MHSSHWSHPNDLNITIYIRNIRQIFDCQSLMGGSWLSFLLTVYMHQASSEPLIVTVLLCLQKVKFIVELLHHSNSVSLQKFSVVVKTSNAVRLESKKTDSSQSGYLIKVLQLNKYTVNGKMMSMRETELYVTLIMLACCILEGESTDDAPGVT